MPRLKKLCRKHFILMADSQASSKAGHFSLLQLPYDTIIIIIISIFLQCPQKRGRWNQLIQRCLSKTKSIGSGSDPESQAGRRLWWMVFGVETRREVGERGQIRIGFAEEQCFKFGVKELHPAPTLVLYVLHMILGLKLINLYLYLYAHLTLNW